MKIRTLLLASALLASACLFAACSPPAQNTSVSPSANTPNAPVPGAASAAGSLQPGQYRTTVTIVSMNMPGMPAGMAEKMRAQPTVTEDCVTSEDVAEMTRKSMVNEEPGQTCTENHITSANGVIDGSATCTRREGGAYTMAMHGAYSANHVEMNMTMSGQTPMGQMSQQMHMVTERIGECSGQSTN